MGDFGEILSGPAGALGFGGVAGALVGYSAKKLSKLVAIGLGALFILIQVLAYNGYLSVDWGAVQNTAEGVWQNDEGLTLADRAWAILRVNLPFAAASSPGSRSGSRQASGPARVGTRGQSRRKGGWFRRGRDLRSRRRGPTGAA